MIAYPTRDQPDKADPMVKINEESNENEYIPAWGISPTKYISEAVSNVDNYLAKNLNG